MKLALSFFNICRWPDRFNLRLVLLCIFCLPGCGSIDTKPDSLVVSDVNNKTAYSEKVVPCRLPGQIRSIGHSFTFVTSRRFIETSESDCKIRGGIADS